MHDNNRQINVMILRRRRPKPLPSGLYLFRWLQKGRANMAGRMLGFLKIAARLRDFFNNGDNLVDSSTTATTLSSCSAQAAVSRPDRSKGVRPQFNHVVRL